MKNLIRNFIFVMSLLLCLSMLFACRADTTQMKQKAFGLNGEKIKYVSKSVKSTDSQLGIYSDIDEINKLMEPFVALDYTQKTADRNVITDENLAYRIEFENGICTKIYVVDSQVWVDYNGEFTLYSTTAE